MHTEEEVQELLTVLAAESAERERIRLHALEREVERLAASYNAFRNPSTYIELRRARLMYCEAIGITS
jgi:hypothetical protein